jgi:hypothetical protein
MEIADQSNPQGVGEKIPFLLVIKILLVIEPHLTMEKSVRSSTAK